MADDDDVLLPNSLNERQAVQEILEAGGAEHHGHQVRGVGFVGGDELIREHLLVVRHRRLELAEARAGSDQLDAELVELGALHRDVGLDVAEAAGERGDARVELSEATRGGAHRAR
jgi:hypothetical protein